MEIKANTRFLRIAPRKVRLLANLIKGLDATKALDQLNFLPKRAAKPMIKLLDSAIANAVHNFELDKNNLYVKSITVDQGPILYRWMPKAMGRATQIRKKTSHIWLVLAERVPSATKKSSVNKKKSEAIEVSPEMIKNDSGVTKVKAVEKKASRDEQSAKGEEIFDVRMKGKHRSKQHLDNKEKKEKGFLKRIFNRKTGV